MTSIWNDACLTRAGHHQFYDPVSRVENMMKGFAKILVLTAAATLAYGQGFGSFSSYGYGSFGQSGSSSNGSSGQSGSSNNGSSGQSGSSSYGNQTSGYQKQSYDFSKFTSGSGLVDVIVQFNQSRNTGDWTKLQSYWDTNDQKQAQNQQSHGQDKHTFNSINAFHLKVPAWAIPFISQMPSVKYVSPVRPVSKMLDVTDATVAANIAWNYGWTGTGVGVAVIDSGITKTSDFGSRIVYSESFVDDTDPGDDYGHGTHVAGIIGANGANSTGSSYTRTFKGIAPNVNLINLRVLDANGSGDESDVIAAIQRAIQLKNSYNIRVINLSLGRPVYESYTLDPLCQAVEAAWKAGIVVVSAAGNSGRDNTYGNNGYGTILAPGNDPYVITVGAMNTKGTTSRWDDIVASYSSKGPTLVDHIVKPDLVAPGNDIVSVLASPNATLPSQYPQTRVPNNYYVSGLALGNSTKYLKLSGTSMSTPVVAGAAALLIQQNPSITPDQVKARLMKTSNKLLPMFSSAISFLFGKSYSNQSDIFTVGAGYLDVNAALTNTDLVQSAALSPTAYLDPVTGRVSMKRGGSGIWGTTDAIVWGDTIVWGTSVLNGALSNGAAIVWGDSLFGSLDAIVWGDSMLTSAPPAPLSAGDSDE
ncbi:MAG TPA: S8 family peptidase [Bryobacteraceae bacterium]|jgi:serine protease AprX